MPKGIRITLGFKKKTPGPSSELLDCLSSAIRKVELPFVTESETVREQWCNANLSSDLNIPLFN